MIIKFSKVCLFKKERREPQLSLLSVIQITGNMFLNLFLAFLIIDYLNIDFFSHFYVIPWKHELRHFFMWTF